MTGARRLALDAILPFARPGLRVLDVGAGASEAARELERRGCDVLAIDRDEHALRRGGCRTIEVLDLSRWERWRPKDPFDLIVAAYALQHFLGREAIGWLHCRECVADDGRMLVVGRYSPVPAREMGRADPLNGYSTQGLAALAMATGWAITSCDLYTYREEDYLCGGTAPNAFVAMLEPL